MRFKSNRIGRSLPHPVSLLEDLEKTRRAFHDHGGRFQHQRLNRQIRAQHHSRRRGILTAPDAGRDAGRIGLPGGSAVGCGVGPRNATGCDEAQIDLEHSDHADLIGDGTNRPG